MNNDNVIGKITTPAGNVHLVRRVQAGSGFAVLAVAYGYGAGHQYRPLDASDQQLLDDLEEMMPEGHQITPYTPTNQKANQ